MNKDREIDIEMDETVAQGNYANLAIISHSTSEFVIDFAAVLPGLTKARVKNRIILSPEHAKRLLMSLQDNITRYETNLGRIELPLASEQEASDEIPPMTIGFNVGEA